MYPNVSRRSVLLAALVLIVATWTACSKTSASGNTAPSSDAGKVAITTKSNDARAEFLQGRDLSEKLLAQDSLQHFEKAIALDPDFATAELARANNSPTAKEFFEHLNKAVSLADKTSDGEKLFILANEAGANGDVVKQKAALDKLVAEYPNDERAHFNLGNYYFGQQDFDGAQEWQRDVAEFVRYQQGVGKSRRKTSRRRDRPGELSQCWRDSLPFIAVRRKSAGANGRQTPGRCHLRPTFEHEWWIGPHYRLHCGSDSAPRVLRRLLLLPQGPISTARLVDEDPVCARGQRQTWCSSRAHLLVKAS